MTTSRQTTVRSVGVLVLLAAVIVGCGRSGNAGSTATEAPTTAEPTTAARTTATEPDGAETSAVSRELEGAHVRVLGLWSGPELESFLAVKAAWEEKTGAVVDWDGTNDLPEALDDRLEAGDPPDIAVLPNLAMMHRLAADGRLVPLESVLDLDQVSRDYAPAWIDLGSHDGTLYGIFYKVSNKATVWFNPRAFAASGYRVPATWSDLIALADTIVADGGTPFSIVAASGPASGWALTDWISEIVLNTCGPDVYDSWIAAQTPWTDACIRESFETFATLVRTKGYVLGGSERILATGDANGADPLYTDPPTAFMYYLASFAQAFIASTYPELTPGDDYDFFPFPAIDPQHRGAITIGADVPVMVSDAPAARSFMAYLAGAQAQEAWIALGGFTSVNRSVAANTYPDPVARAVAEELTEADVVRFSAGDMMPASLQRAWWEAMLELVRDPSTVDSLLASLDAAARTAG